jgi:urease accessory protein
MSHSHTHDHDVSHSHDDPFNGHGHSHDILDGPGSYLDREMPLIEGRDWKDRAFTIGIGGYVYSLSLVYIRSPSADCPLM